MSYNDQRELAALPGRIAALETEQTGLQQRLDDSGLFVRDPEGALAATRRLAEIEEELLILLERWTELEA